MGKMKNCMVLRKYLTILFGATIIAISSTSCSKAYNCHCVYKTNGTIDREDDHQINEGKKSKTEAKCNEMDKSSTSTVGSTTFVSTTECELTN